MGLFISSVFFHGELQLETDLETTGGKERIS
jgi:hypothetical protein